jgi:hypothetical protein
MVVKRMGKWWGYLVVEPDPAEARVNPPPSVWLVQGSPMAAETTRITRANDPAPSAGFVPVLKLLMICLCLLAMMIVPPLLLRSLDA